MFEMLPIQENRLELETLQMLLDPNHLFIINDK
jgi:hypothetical protein